MQIDTSRFGTVQISDEDVIRFPSGMPGLEECTSWVLLADAHNDALGWLQCTTQPEVALAVVSPRRFVPNYQLRVARSELGPALAEHLDTVHVLVTVSKHNRGITLNLKAPLVIHLPGRLGRQVVASGEQPVQYLVGSQTTPLRKVA